MAGMTDGTTTRVQDFIGDPVSDNAAGAARQA